jgi:uncharacterized membrane-anchored protein YitT (DUF2179 family)
MFDYVLLLTGSFVIAFSFNMFLNPNQIASGGVSGISTIVQHVMGMEPAITQWLLNIPLFVAGLWLLGGKFGLKTAVGSVVLPLFVLLTSRMTPWTDNTLLASIYGGFGVGLGLGIVFRGRGSTGGLDLAAQIIHKYAGFRLGVCVALLDGAVILTAGLVFTPEKALYALIGLFVTSKTIDFVQMGFSVSKVAYIITGETEAVSKAILHDLDRGLTVLDGTGGYTREERKVLMVVVDQKEVSKLKQMVSAIDPRAFVIISHASEVLGEGFKV